MNDIVPDYMSALVGYRAWNVTPSGDLLSLNQNTAEPWPNKYKHRALCMNQRDEMWHAEQLLCGGTRGMAYMTTQAYITSTAYVAASVSQISDAMKAKFKALFAEAREELKTAHHCPMPDCACGIYAAKSKESEHFQGYADGSPVWGEVYLWGKVQEYSQGYRAEFAYPKALSTSIAHLAPAIAERYGVPCEAVERPAPMDAGEYAVGFSVSTSVLSSGSTSGWQAFSAPVTLKKKRGFLSFLTS